MTRHLDAWFQQLFLGDEVYRLTLQATVQRSGLYAPDVLDRDRQGFRRGLRQALEEAAEPYADTVPEAQHIEAIEALCRRMSGSHSDVLHEGRFRIGHAQKALNLFLKYYWCMGWIVTPPHCPFDARIIQRLPLRSRINWTDLDDIGKYKALVAAARSLAGDEPLAVWELRAYSEAPRSIPLPMLGQRGNRGAEPGVLSREDALAYLG